MSGPGMPRSSARRSATPPKAAGRRIETDRQATWASANFAISSASRSGRSSGVKL